MRHIVESKSYRDARGVRREQRTILGRFRGGKLVPVMATVVRGSEGGMLSQSITMELDPIAGRLLTPTTGELFAVAVPVQAMHALKHPEADYAGLTDVIREELLSGSPIFTTEVENILSQRCGVNPRSVAGFKRVSEAVRLAHNCGVNFLRLRKYHKATQVLAASTAITPAIISQTVLDRFNGVLDPDDRINGQVELELAGQAKVYGLGFNTSEINPTSSTNTTVIESGSDARVYPRSYSAQAHAGAGAGAAQLQIEVGTSGAVPNIFADLNQVFGGGISLADMYNAETKDRLTRMLQKMAEENPQYGEEMVLRYAHGLSVDVGKTPFLIHNQAAEFGRQIIPATDTAGVQNDVMRSDMMLVMNFNAMIPKTELGLIIVTFAVLKPDETISSQPHPFLSEPWGLDNFIADELALDPVAVTMRELYSDVPQAQENTISMYTGLNALKSTYVHYGMARNLDPNTVANKTAIWQLDIPLSVTPDAILYPENLSHYPFADQNAEVVTYTVSSTLTLQTPMVMGPTPVETLAIIDGENIFGDQE